MKLVQSVKSLSPKPTKQNILIGFVILVIAYFVLVNVYKQSNTDTDTNAKKEGHGRPLHLKNHTPNTLYPTQGIYQPEYRYAYRNTPDAYGWYAKGNLWSLVGSLNSTDMNDDSILNLYRRPSRVYTGYYEYRVETENSNVYLDPHVYKLLKHDDELYVPGLEGTGIWTVVLNEW